MRSSRSSRWSIDVQQDWINVTSERPTPNESWRFTDTNGHEHTYDRGYPTLNQVIDERHWCDGTEGPYNHDPHMAVDASHLECKICGETVKTKMDPPYTPKQIPGMRNATLSGRFPVDRGWKHIKYALREQDMDALQQCATDDDIDAFAETIPAEQVLDVNYSVTSA